MAGEHLQEPLIDDSEDRGNDRLQESVFTDIATGVSAVASAGGLGLGLARYRRDGRNDEHARLRAELEAELADARRALDLERRARIVAEYGLAGLDYHDRYGVIDDFTGFGVEGESVDLTRDDWFDVG